MNDLTGLARAAAEEIRAWKFRNYDGEQSTLQAAFPRNDLHEQFVDVIATALREAVERETAERIEYFADTRRLLAWLGDPRSDGSPLPRPEQAFTAGPERRIADLIYGWREAFYREERRAIALHNEDQIGGGFLCGHPVACIRNKPGGGAHCLMCELERETAELRAELSTQGVILTAAQCSCRLLEHELAEARRRLLSAAGDDLCRLTQEEIKAMSAGAVKIPPEEEFLASCRRFHAQVSGEVGVMDNCLTLAQLVAENERQRADLTAARDANTELGKQIARQAETRAWAERAKESQAKMTKGVWVQHEEQFQRQHSELTAARAFKKWTHAWLDKNGVPADPDPQHTAATGCRISGRMEWWKENGDARPEFAVANKELTAAREEIARLKALARELISERDNAVARARYAAPPDVKPRGDAGEDAQ